MRAPRSQWRTSLVDRRWILGANPKAEEVRFVLRPSTTQRIK